MFKSLKPLIVTAAILMSQMAQAEKITVVIPYRPGGAADQVMQVLKVAAQKQGNEIDIQYHRSCAESIEFVKNSQKNVFLSIGSDAYDPTNPGAVCKVTHGVDNLRVWGSTSSSPFYFCSAPHRSMSFSDLVLMPRTIGATSVPDLMTYLNHILSNTLVHNQFKIIPYRGGGEVVKAAQSGDIDAWFGSSQIKAFSSDKIVCYGSSVRDDSRKIPFVGNLVKPGISVPEYPLVNVLITNSKNLSREASNAMALAINSSDFREYLAKNKMTAGTFDGNTLHSELVNLTQSINKMQSTN